MTNAICPGHASVKTSSTNCMRSKADMHFARVSERGEHFPNTKQNHHAYKIIPPPLHIFYVDTLVYPTHTTAPCTDLLHPPCAPLLRCSTAACCRANSPHPHGQDENVLAAAVQPRKLINLFLVRFPCLLLGCFLGFSSYWVWDADAILQRVSGDALRKL